MRLCSLSETRPPAAHTRTNQKQAATSSQVQASTIQSNQTWQPKLTTLRQSCWWVSPVVVCQH